MRREQIVSGITTGLIPTAATLGMLIGFGVRLGSATRVLRTIGEMAFGGNFRGAVTAYVAAGALLHVIAVLSCGVAYVLILGDDREHRVASAIAVGGTVVIAATVAARTFAGSIALVLTPANLIAIGVVIAITLPIGMRLALSRV